MKKARCLILISILLSSVLLSAIPTNALTAQVYNFDRIWYHNTIGFNKNGQGTLILAVTYTNATAQNPNFREIDYCHIEFHQDPFYFGIEFQEESEITYDDEGNIIYQEPSDGYVYLRKSVVDNYLPNSIKRIASSINYSTITFQNIKWYRIYVPNFNRLYEWKKFNEPDEKKWYTWGNNNSIAFETKAMYIQRLEYSFGHLEFEFTHPTDNSGQVVRIAKSYLSSKGITNPYFEWGEVIPWKVIPYSENTTHYFINPDHFSVIGMHSASDGYQSALMLNSSTDIYDKTTSTYCGGSASGGYVTGDHYQTFNSPDNFSRINSIKIYYKGATGAVVTNSTVGIADSSGTWISYTTVNDTAPLIDAGHCAETYNIPDVFISTNIEHRLRVVLNWAGDATYGWSKRHATASPNPYPGGSGDFDATNDYQWILYGRNSTHADSLNLSRSVGASSERNIVNDTTNHSYNDTICVKIKVPLSDSTQGISEVLNQTTITVATNVTVLANLVNNTYYYDSANQFVWIGTENISSGQLINWSVNCTYGAEFDVEPPTFVVLGLPFEFIGLIKDANGDGIDGYIATTKIMYTNNTNAIEPVEYNCSNGNIFCTISTCSLTPGQYKWQISFYDSGSGVVFKKGGDLSVSYGIHGHYDAIAIFNVYDDSTGLASHSPQFTFYDPSMGVGMNTVILKLYVSEDTTFTEADRVNQQDFSTYTGQTLYYKVLDYFNNTIYPDYDGYDTIVITSINQFIDIPIQMWMFSVKNMNHSIVLFELHNGTRAYTAYLFPYEPFYWYVFNGSYIINITYYNPETDAVVDYHNTTIDIDNHTYYWVRGYDLQDIIIEIQVTNSSLNTLMVTIETNISLVNSSIDSLVVDFVTNLSITESNITSVMYNVWTSLNITNSTMDYMNATIWTNLTLLNSTLHAVNLTIVNAITLTENNITSLIITIDNIIDYALMPDAVIWSTNPPIIISCFDRIGMELGQNIWKVCPALNVIATTRNTTTGNWINSTYLIPSNGTTENGTITLLEDIIYIFGNGSVNWVNLTYTDNGTLYQNTTYIPGRLHVFGENFTINSSCDIRVERETRYNQLKKFYWGIYNYTDNPGHITGRAGYHTAGIEVINPLNTTLYDVYVFIGFSDKTNPDANTVQVRDVENGVLLERGENFKTTEDGIDFRLTGSMNASATRNFVVGYYSDFSSNYIYDDGQVYVTSFEKNKKYGSRVPFYNYFEVPFTNDRSLTFRGGIFVILNLRMLKTEIDLSSVLVRDLDNNIAVERSDCVIGTGFILLTSEIVGDVSPGGARNFAVYFLESEYPGADPKDIKLNTNLGNFLGIPWTPFFMLFIILCIPISIGFARIAWTKAKKPTGIDMVLIVIPFVFLFVLWILSAQGL